MQKRRVTQKFVGSAKILALAICFVVLSSLAVTPLYGQLSAARNLSGTWQSSSSGLYYEMDPAGTGIRESDVTATFEMDITQSGNQIEISLYLNPTSWATDSAYEQEYGIPGAPPVAGEIDFSGTVSSSSFTADETGSQLTSEQLTGTFTSNIITATLSGTAEQTDQNGIVVTLTSSATPAPTQASTSAPSTTNQPLASRYYGDISSVKGQASTNSPSGNTPLSSGQTVSGTEFLTGDNGIIAFEPPNQGGTVYLGANSDAGWVGMTSEPAPDNAITYMIYPPVSSGTIFPNGNEQLNDLKIAVPLDFLIAVLVFTHPLGQAAAVTLFVEGGAFLIPNGVAYIKETVSHLIAVPQGALAGQNTEYTVNVFSNGTTLVQVIDGPVIFMDPITNNTITVDTNQLLTLPPAQASGFTESELQSYVSTLDSASVNQWWTQGSTNTFALNILSTQTLMIFIIAVVFVIVIAGIGASVVRKRKVTRQIHASESPPPAPNPQPATQTTPTLNHDSEPSPQPATEQPKLRFCPNCGQKLPVSKRFCPFCGFDMKPKDEKQGV
jgi:hypothetical protein